MKSNRSGFSLPAIFFGMLWLPNAVTAQQRVEVRDPYGLEENRRRIVNSTFRFRLENHDTGPVDTRDLGERGDVNFINEFSPQMSLRWLAKTPAREEFVLWPARVEGMRTPCRDFRLAKIGDDLGLLGRDGMVASVSRNDFVSADKILQQMLAAYSEGEGVAMRSNFEWRLALHTHLTSVVDTAIRGPLSSSSSLSKSERLSALKHVTGWMRLHRSWIESPGRLTPHQQARMISEMAARIENCATRSYMKDYLRRDGSWPDRTLDDFKSVLPNEAAREILWDDIAFLLDCVEEPQIRELLNRQVSESSGIDAGLKQQWDTLVSHGTWEGIALFKDNADEVVGNVRLAALEKIVDIINKSAAATRG